jgi:hypothetical protein
MLKVVTGLGWLEVTLILRGIYAEKARIPRRLRRGSSL